MNERLLTEEENERKPRPDKKVNRNDLMRQYAGEHPSASLTEIGAIFGIKKQRVAQIIGKRPRQQR